MYLSYDLLGSDAAQRADYLSTIRNMSKMLEDKIPEIVQNNKKFIYVKSVTGVVNSEFSRYLRKRAPYMYTNKGSWQETFAVMLSFSELVPDIVFTARRIRCIWYILKHSEVVSYQDIGFEEGKLIIGKDRFSNRNANMEAVYKLIQAYAEKYGESRVKYQDELDASATQCIEQADL